MSIDDRDIAQTVRHPLWRICVITIVVALLLTAALGGFRKAPNRGVAEMPLHVPGQMLDSTLFRVVPSPGWLTFQLPNRDYPSTEESYLLVPVVITSQAQSGYSATANLQSDLVWLQQDAQGKPKPVQADQVIRADDGTFGIILQPQLAVPVLAIWKLPAHAPAPASIRLGLGGRRFVARTALTTESAWLRDKAVGLWRIPLQDRRQAAEPPP